MIRLYRKKQRGKEQGINDICRIYSCIIQRLSDILCVMVEYVVTADKLCSMKKRNKFRYRSLMKNSTVIADPSNIKNFPAMRLNFSINEGNWFHFMII